MIRRFKYLHYEKYCVFQTKYLKALNFYNLYIVLFSQTSIIGYKVCENVF